MKQANFTTHAKKRIGERCSLSQDEVKRILDNNSTVVISLQKGGRYAHRLLYSIADEEWFMIVQDGGDGGVLTVMPLDYLKGRTSVTAANKRSARNKALRLEKTKNQTPAAPQPIINNPAEVKKPTLVTIPPLPGWKIQVSYFSSGTHLRKNIGRTFDEHGEPSNWIEFGSVHKWIREKLNEFKIPITAVRGFVATRGKVSVAVDGLLEWLPLTDEEKNSFK